MRITDRIYWVGSGCVGISAPGDCHTYLIEGDDALALVDCGMSADPRAILEEIRRDASLNEYRRDLFCSLLEDMGAQVQPSNANFLLCDFGRDMSDAVWYLKTRNILVRECASFGLGANYLRLAVRTEEENRLLTEELKKWLAS